MDPRLDPRWNPDESQVGPRWDPPGPKMVETSEIRANAYPMGLVPPRPSFFILAVVGYPSVPR